MLFRCNNCSHRVNSKDQPASCPECDNTFFSIESIELSPDTQIAGFKLIKKIGEGGMGEVWIADQLSVSRLVALKILFPSATGGSGYEQRFLTEVKHSSRLDHPNIVKTIDAGCHKGIFYLACSYVKGKVLQQLLQENKTIPEQESLKIALSISEGLSYAWNNFNLLHRDIKPSNIIIDIKGIAVLLDLGVAKNTAEDPALTMEGEVVGTPYYMSPEQSKSNPLDCRSDIYSLGATLYHMLTGTVPYEGNTSMAILTKHITTKLIPPIEKNSDISEATSALIQKMMAKNKNNRFLSWEEVIEQIKIILSGKAKVNILSSNTKKPKSKLKLNKGAETSIPDYKLIQKNQPKQQSVSQTLKIDEKKIPAQNVDDEQIYIPPDINYDMINRGKKIRLKNYSNKLLIPYTFASLIITGIAVACLCGYMYIDLQGSFYNLKPLNNCINQASGQLLLFTSKLLWYKPTEVTVSINIFTLISYFSLVLVILWSAFLSADIAEKTDKNRLTGFMLGAVLPVIYPLLKAKASTNINQHTRKIIYNPIVSPPYMYNQDFFCQAFILEHEGPHKIGLIDNTFLYVSKIIDAEEKFLIVEIESKDKNSNIVHLPYEKIKTFKPLD